MNVRPWWRKASAKASRSLPSPQLGHAEIIIEFLAHLLISENQGHTPNLLSWFKHNLFPKKMD